ncbi:tetratricopeptide repeat protein [Streptomyces sp. 142MFCol3.1]|uniref:tetratricopeptide repeat protein n=1 Tax=Streptomyces sp. 142MFCol3.1 TaxID=1172179 RepID=UPI001F3C6BA7|nr:tetratricopeptide repeat protein [Streptomyces sp. 142MFCol3.1]
MAPAPLRDPQSALRPLPETAPVSLPVTQEFRPVQQPQRPEPDVPPAAVPAPEGAPASAPVAQPAPAVAESGPASQPVRASESEHGSGPRATAVPEPQAAPVQSPAAVLRSEPAPAPAPAPAPQPVAEGPTPATFVLRAVPEPKPLPGSAATHVLRAVPESAAGAVAAPTGEFGPAPVSEPAPARKAATESAPLLDADPEPEPKPAPVRGFDAVAEAVLDQAPEGDGSPQVLQEPVARINEAVKMGRIEAAAGMAEQAVAEASHSLGQEHPEVLKLRELTAYIAYLAGDALRSFHLSLDLAQVRRRHRDPRAAYGNVQSAAAAWRAVRDPLQGLHLGRDLIGVWAELAADGGPAAEDIEQLESARTRMGRLSERARVMADNPYAQTPRAHGQ